MSAYNELLIHDTCPVCRNRTEIRCQLHVAATYEGDDRGRFALREYHLGEPLWWWPPSDRRYADWRDDADRVMPDGSVDECSYATCSTCRADLYVGVRIREHSPVAVLSISTDRPPWCRS